MAICIQGSSQQNTVSLSCTVGLWQAMCASQTGSPPLAVSIETSAGKAWTLSPSTTGGGKKEQDGLNPWIH